MSNIAIFSRDAHLRPPLRAVSRLSLTIAARVASTEDFLFLRASSRVYLRDRIHKQLAGPSSYPSSLSDVAVLSSPLFSAHVPSYSSFRACFLDPEIQIEFGLFARIFYPGRYEVTSRFSPSSSRVSPSFYPRLDSRRASRAISHCSRVISPLDNDGNRDASSIIEGM